MTVVRLRDRLRSADEALTTASWSSPPPFDERSLRLCTSAGFLVVHEFTRPDVRPFVELLLDLQG
jgi:hypothetical protein